MAAGICLRLQCLVQLVLSVWFDIMVFTSPVGSLLWNSRGDERDSTTWIFQLAKEEATEDGRKTEGKGELR